MKYKIAFFLFDCFTNTIFKTFRNLRISGGPFKGMVYLSRSVGSSLTPKILGTYERELNNFIKELPRFHDGIDVGAAEGYYAVGLLKTKVCERVIAWETTDHGRELLSSLAEVNGVRGSLDIRGACSPENLNNELRSRVGIPTLMVIDCEGFEGPLLENIEDLLIHDCTMIIETHDMMNPGVHGRLLTKLSKTHQIIEVSPAKRSVTNISHSLPLPLRVFRIPIISRMAMSERRCAGIRWLLCSPLDKNL
jgi:hypothetical protein